MNDNEAKTRTSNIVIVMLAPLVVETSTVQSQRILRPDKKQ